MESLGDSCHSISDSFSLYERFMRSFNVVEHTDHNPDLSEPSSSSNDSTSPSGRGNIDLSAAHNVTKHCELDCNLPNQVTCDNVTDKCSSSDIDCVKVDSPCPSPASLENSYATVDHSLTEKSNQTDVPTSSDESRRESFKQPIFITSTMENSNNAVDSVPLFTNRPSDSVFKLPIGELSFNGTIKHVQKLKPNVDPIRALTSNPHVLEEKSNESIINIATNEDEISSPEHNSNYQRSYTSDEKSNDINKVEKTSESAGDSQYEEFRKDCPVIAESNTTWNIDHSSSFEASFDSGVRSPDMFSDGDDEEAEPVIEQEPFWSFIKDYENNDKKKFKKIEETLSGVPPPPSVTSIKVDVTEMLKKYYSGLSLFNENTKLNVSEEANCTTPTKRVSFVEIPNNTMDLVECTAGTQHSVTSKEGSRDKLNVSEANTSVNDSTVELKRCTELEAMETTWPDLVKCKYYDVYYNVTKYSEKLELLLLKYGERYVGAETETSVNIYSGGFQSPSSANKRKALRLKMAQAKSPGRRLSHLARRRQAFCNAATINEKAHTSTSKMVLIDKNFFPHRKLINSAERKSPRTRRTPGKKTPNRKTPGKKTPAKTPKTRSGGSSKKKAMRRLLMDSESITRSQPTRETLKRALFISPENRKPVPTASCSSVPVQAMRTKRALFGSPVRPAETKSSDGTQSDHFLKRKLDALDERPESSRSKIAKSLSFGGDSVGNSQSISFVRRASEVYTAKKSTDLNDNHKQKLLWAVSEALRVHGWRMSSPGFREKAGSLARLTRRLLTLPPHHARLQAPNLSTSDTMLKIARLYVFAIIQGRSVEECFEEEQMKLANETNTKVTGYISAYAYQQSKNRSIAPKENTGVTIKQEPRSGTKNVLQDKLVNIDSNSNSSSGLSSVDKVPLFKSNSMPPTFEEAAKMRARRQISFDNVDFPKR